MSFRPKIIRKFKNRDFRKFKNQDFEALFEAINEKLNGTLHLSNTPGAGGTNRNRQTLADYLNQRNAYSLIYGETNIDAANLEDIQNYIEAEHARLEDEERARLEAEHLEDQQFFKNFDKDRYKSTEPIDVIEKMKTQDKFDKFIAVERQIAAAKEALKKACDLINKNLHPILQNEDRLIIPDAPLNKKAQQFNYMNGELYDYLNDHYHKFTHKQPNKEYLIINTPVDYDEAVQKMSEYEKYEVEDVVDKKFDNKPIKIYYFNQISSLDDIYASLQKVYDSEPKPFKIHFQLSGVFETREYNFSKMTTTYSYEAREIRWQNYQQSIPIIVHDDESLNLVKLYIESILHSYETASSNNKLCIVGSISFTVSKMRKVTGHIKDLPVEFKKNNLIITDDVDDNLCWYRFLAICLDEKLQNTKEYGIKYRTNAAKRLLLENHGIKYGANMSKNNRIKAKEILENFAGVSVDEMKEDAAKYKININIYEYIDGKYYDLQDQWFLDKSYKTYSALLYSKDGVLHIMYIKDTEKLTGLLICPKCKSYVVSKHNANRMNSHLKKCSGHFQKQFVPMKEALPYCPHILNNPIYEYCLAYGIEWKPTIYYMTYDFETMEERVNKTVGKTTLNSRIVPLSVASTVKTSKGLISKWFSLRDSDTFIIEWIEWLFEQSVTVLHDKVEYLSSFTHLPIQKLREIDSRLNTITILGFNSSHFDVNLFKKHLNTNHWKVDSKSLIGSLSSLKQVILTSSKYETKLRFIDAQAFVSGGSLEDFVTNFSGIESSSVKGIFPYEAINTTNYNDILSKSEPFEYNDFYSYLKQRNITQSQYSEYLKDASKFKSRWEYLEAYNINDTVIMIDPIDKLIEHNAKFNVDLISNLSLSKNASCIKYALAYKNFDVNENYGIINKENTFKITYKWFEFKCHIYYTQDLKYNREHTLALPNSQRDLDKCVSVDDYDEFIKMYNDPIKGRCHLCGEHFTNSNKPTLDRIDNSKGHELRNCLLACAECNKLRKRDDPKINRLRIQLKKYCKLNHLPTLINDATEYYSLRDNMTGGISNVLHRVNIKGETLINRFRYVSSSEGKDDKVLSIDTDNVQTHILGIDFNSLYPSTSASIKHDFNRYHGGIMYMPGGFIMRIDATTKQLKSRCISIITSKSRFDANPKYLFKAEVKLKCPKSKINYFINLPPIFRNINIKNDRQTIGSYMYDYMKKNNLISIDKEERKLTMLIDTCDEYMTFSNYYLWFLLDHGLILEDVRSVSLYEAHTGFNEFSTTFAKLRQENLDKRDLQKFYKMTMNGSFGYDAINTSKFSKIRLCDTDKAYQYIISSSYLNGVEIGPDNYIIQQMPKIYRCHTCLQEAFWNLDNAKYWYLTFYYDFIVNCLDVERLHLISCDTDSFYFAMSSIPECTDKGLGCIVKNKEFYDENVFKFMPNPDSSDIKKLLGCCIERIGENMIAPAPKCYSIWDSYDTPDILKLKGISLKTNAIDKNDYENVIKHSTVKTGRNINFQMKNNVMSLITTVKNAITGTHTKMVVLPNQSCLPFIHGLTSNDYLVSQK